MNKKIDKAALASRILALEGIAPEDKSALLELLSEQKKFGLVWEEKTEEAQDLLEKKLPILAERTDLQIVSNNQFPNHILIEGDNLHALSALAFSYEGSFDVIYIDPPYNTGATAWRYNNDYVDKDDEFKHSKWLSMMYHRLRIAKRLLNRENSALIVTIDEIECSHLACMLEEMFPTAKIQMVTSIICPGGRGKKAAVDLSNTEEFIFFVRLGECSITPEIKNEEQMPLGWRSLIRGTLANGRGQHGIGSCGPNQFYPIYVEDATKKIIKIGDPLPESQSRFTAPQIIGCTAVFPVRPDGTEMNWGCVPEEAVARLKNGYLRVSGYSPNKPQPYVIQYLTKGVIQDIEEGKAIITGKNHDGSVEGFYPVGKPTMPTTVWNRPTHNATQYGTNLLTSILGSQKFDYPKSLNAVKDCLRFVAGEKRNAKILDFFAGSGTTLHATMQLNAEDGGHRQCILVTNNENNICEEVTYERNKRVIQGYTTPKGQQVEGLKNNNLRYYKVDFVEREKTAANQKELMKASTDLLCIKENLYQEETCFEGLKLHEQIARCFSDGVESGKKMLIIYEPNAIPVLVKRIEQMSVDKENKLKVYVMAEGQYPYTEDFESVLSKVELRAMPHALYQAMRQVLPPPAAAENTEPDREVSDEEADGSIYKSEEL